MNKSSKLTAYVPDSHMLSGIFNMQHEQMSRCVGTFTPIPSTIKIPCRIDNLPFTLSDEYFMVSTLSILLTPDDKYKVVGITLQMLTHDSGVHKSNEIVLSIGSPQKYEVIMGPGVEFFLEGLAKHRNKCLSQHINSEFDASFNAYN